MADDESQTFQPIVSASVYRNGRYEPVELKPLPKAQPRQLPPIPQTDPFRYITDISEKLRTRTVK
jgi:hypothetical protein